MGMSLSKLMESVGNAVQNANMAIEQYAAQAYLRQGYTENDEESLYEPITYMLDLPASGGKKRIGVPATILMHHSSLQLEQVDVKLRFAVEESDGEELMISVRDEKDGETVSELSMQFKTAALPEGMARVENRHIQTL